MDIRQYTSATEVLEKVGKCLMEREAENNLPLGLLHRLKKNEEKRVKYEPGKEPFIAVVEENDGKLGMIMVQTPPDNLVICGKEEFIKPIVKWLCKKGIDLPGVVGCKPIIDKFVEAWVKETNKTPEVFMRQLIYRLDELQQIPRQKGRLCYATEDDLTLVTYWTQQFHEEALEPIDKKRAEEFVKNEIKNNTIFLWRTENCTPVSMAKRARETKNGVVINLVYTPDEYKRQGYATTCVAALSEWLLKEGFKFCSLYTDLDNPTSNSIYTKIGYKPIAESVEYRFI
ncbi:putative GNAT family acetyltransferase [Evansella vedderi]|uniref:GNAT family acetyltransferase n=1 Tax=Evansella vedderi TaxID=38282 RepID=A0ABU0A1G4_9BACI|nr:GNAT family N-acetyltransferase [Evansella vedderi]MDQ0257326.1 putative GNAT family acetyltransferase [Evansella vedderi]